MPHTIRLPELKGTKCLVWLFVIDIFIIVESVLSGKCFLGFLISSFKIMSTPKRRRDIVFGLAPVCEEVGINAHFLDKVLQNHLSEFVQI